MTREYTSNSPDETFALGEKIGTSLAGGEIVLLSGGLGAGKTLMTKGILGGLEYDVDEVTSPSFSLVNLYKTERFDVYHIDLWRLEHEDDAASVVGLDEITEDPNNIAVIEWADRLTEPPTGRKIIFIEIKGDGGEPREISIQTEAEADINAF